MSTSHSGASAVRVELKSDDVAVIVLDRPAAMNALDRRTFAALTGHLENIATDGEVRAVVLTGAGGVFSAGGDLDDLAAMRELSAEELEVDIGDATHVSALIDALPQPTIAAIDGPAAGGALGLALACDIRIASPRARFLSPFIRMGIVPDCGLSWTLPRLIGHAAALELMLTGRPIDADHAKELGLLSQVTEEPLETAIELAAMFARRPPQAAIMTKRLLRQAASGNFSEAIRAETAAQAAAMSTREFEARFNAWRSTRSAD